jgi:hypothetical protein
MSEATKPAVNARSTTGGPHSSEAANQHNSTPQTTRSVHVQRILTNGSSTTANKVHAASIQLTNKGMTALDGLLANGLSQGKTMHSTNMMLRTKRFCAVDEFMA